MLQVIFVALRWFSEEVKAIAIVLYEGFMSGVASFLEAMPVPDFMANVPSYTLPPVVSWAAEPFQLEYGIGIVVTAYIARFTLRRIPGIG